MKFTTNAQLDDSDAILGEPDAGTYMEEPVSAMRTHSGSYRVWTAANLAITVDGEEVLFDDTTDTAAYV